MASRVGEQEKTWFRTDRFIHTSHRDCGWYVALRDGDQLGPYDTRQEAEMELIMYMRDQGVLFRVEDGDLVADWVSGT
jgi:hypothetical protein